VRDAVIAVPAILLLSFAGTGQAVEMKTLPGHLPSAVTGLHVIGSLPDSERLDLAISLPLRDKPGLASLLHQIYDPASRQFHRYLNPAEFAQQFGPTQGDYQAVIDFATAHHFKVTRLHPNRTLLDVNAPVGEIRNAFHLSIKVYPHPREDRAFYAPDANPSVEANIPILRIQGLDNLMRPHPNSAKSRLPLGGAASPSGGSGPGGGYISKDFRAAYVPGVALTGAGQTAALVEFDGYYPSDVLAYEATNRLSNVLLTNVLIDGYLGNPFADNGEEDTLDIDMLIAMAPGLSKIVVYEENLFGAADDLLNRIATDDSANQISCSWHDFDVDAETDQIFQQFAAQGQSFFCASDDFGADPPGQVHVPTGDPYITVVGGTVLSTAGAAGAWRSETVWNGLWDDVWMGSGGGFATNYAIPDWQAGVSMATNQGSTAFRNLPDVAMCAANIFVIADDGESETFVGTSAAAPLWAGFAALVNQQAASYGNGPIGFLNPALYAIGASAGYATNFHDITVGNNTNSESPNAYFAVAGYDLCTGWGTPDGGNLINTLAPPDTLVMLPIAGLTASGPGGGPINVTAETFLLTNEGSASLSWSLETDAPWLSASPTNGDLSPLGSASVSVNFNNAAYSLDAGSYVAHLIVTNLANGLMHRRSFTLQISDPMTISPAAGLTFGGPPSGPFNVTAQTCELTNAGAGAVAWSLLASPPWLDVSPGSGLLAPDASATMSCSLNAAATNLPPGTYPATLVFSNSSFAAEESVPVLLMVGQLVQNGGFETGNLADWMLTGDVSHVVASTYSGAVHSGAYGVFIENGGGPGYLSQSLPTVPGQTYSVSLWLDSQYDLTPTGFSVAWAGNTLCAFTNLTEIGWTNLQFTVAAANTFSVLKIGFANGVSFFGLDDISVTAASPGISAVTPASGSATGGTIVTIAGVGFQNQATVSFGSIAAASVTVNSTSNITAVTPVWSVGPVTVSVTNADGQSAVLTNGFVFVGTPVITWTNPPALTYGAALGAGQLNAIASVPGAFVYDPPAGAVLNAGTNLLAAVFTPNDTTDYYSATDFVSVVVSPAPLIVTASNASRIYGVANPPFTGAIAGLENGDNITASFNCNATPASPAGTYPIVPSLTDTNNRLPNYEVSIIDGVLTIAAPAPPVFQSATQTSNMITISWSATAGETYQVQYNSSLTAANWADLGGPVTATNAVLTASDSLTNGQSYYRVLLTPQ
jgi:hypothetical protein